MQSHIFQISLSPVIRENWLSENEVFENVVDSLGSTAIDYAEKLHSDKERAEAISNLILNCLPKGMFELNPDGSISYMGGIEKWIKEVYISNIQRAAKELCFDRAFSVGIGSAFQIEKAISNPLDIGSLFIMSDDDHYSRVIRSGDFMGEYVKYMLPGQLFYIGAVYDYHF